MAVGDQVVRRHSQLESSTALTTKASPDTDGGELVDHLMVVVMMMMMMVVGL